MADQEKTRISVLISGNGSNLQALIDATKDSSPISNCNIIRVISNRKAAYGLVRAQEAGISTFYHNLLEYKKKYPDVSGKYEQARSQYDLDLATKLLGDTPDLIVCAGWMHILSDVFVDGLAVAGVPVINLHPALPGEYNGSNAIERAHQDWLLGKISRSGIMIHYVINEVDMGKPIITEKIPFVKGKDEDIEIFKEKVHAREHELIVFGTAIAVSTLQDRSAI